MASVKMTLYISRGLSSTDTSSWKSAGVSRKRVPEDSGYAEPLSLCSPSPQLHNSARKIHANAAESSPDECREILEQAREAAIGNPHWLAWEAVWFPLLVTLLFAFEFTKISRRGRSGRYRLEPSPSHVLPVRFGQPSKVPNGKIPEQHRRLHKVSVLGPRQGNRALAPAFFEPQLDDIGPG